MNTSFPRATFDRAIVKACVFSFDLHETWLARIYIQGEVLFGKLNTSVTNFDEETLSFLVCHNGTLCLDDYGTDIPQTIYTQRRATLHIFTIDVLNYVRMVRYVILVNRSMFILYTSCVISASNYIMFTPCKGSGKLFYSRTIFPLIGWGLGTRLYYTGSALTMEHFQQKLIKNSDIICC